MYCSALLKNLEAEIENWQMLNCIIWRGKGMKYIVAKAGSYCQSWRIVVVVVRTSCSSNSSSSLVVGLMVAVVVAEVLVVK